MPKLTIFQAKIQRERDEYILKLAEEGYKLREIAKMVEAKYRYPISLQRVHQIVTVKLQEQK